MPMPKIKIDGVEGDFENGMTLLQACEQAGKEVPRFCYHERLFATTWRATAACVWWK
jgi:NADH dehydrogenase/NADH:ubiquinone oxidoreductase subunit G